MKAIPSFFILCTLLACFSNFVGANDVCEAYVNGTCTACRAGFTLNSSNNCTCATLNCQNCSADSNNNSICSLCSMYFGTKESDMSSCKSCYVDACQNCTLSSEGLPTCTICEYGYYLQNGKCLKCSDRVDYCLNCSMNGTFQCHSCGNIGDELYSNGTACVLCQPVKDAGNCYNCKEFAAEPPYCYFCKTGFFQIDFDSSCVQCKSKFPHCASCSVEYCSGCEDGYFLNSSSVCQPICSTMENCYQCDGDATFCTYCKGGSYRNYSGICVSCSEFENYPLNCSNVYCYNYSGLTQSCLECNSGFVNLYQTNNDTNQCVSCNQNITNCASCVGSYYNSSYSYPRCSQCEDGYKIQINDFKLDTEGSITCVQNCSANHYWYNNSLIPIYEQINYRASFNSACFPCKLVEGGLCNTCNETHCFSCISPAYLLINPETNTSCSLCQNSDTDSLVTVGNQTFCSRKTKAILSNLTINNSNITFNLTCSVSPARVMLVYGPETSVDSLSLENDVLPNVESKNYTNIPSTSDTAWVGFGSRLFITQNVTGNSTKIILIPPFKFSGESFKLRIWCQNLLNTSDISNTSISWIQPNNGGKKTQLTVSTNTQLTATQKKTLGYVIKKTLKLAREMYTDVGDLVPFSVSSSRLLQNANSTNTYINTFYVLPDYTATTDDSATLINQTLQNSTTFLASLSTVLLNVLGSSSFTVSSITAVTVNSTNIQPVLADVNLNMNGNTLTITFNLTNCNGTFYAGAEITTYGLVLANLSSANLNYPNWNLFLQGKNYSSNTLAKFTNVSAVAGQLSQISLTSLDSNKTYLIYYGAANNDIPPAYTQLYVNVANTVSNDGSNCALRICSYIGLIGLLILVILN